MTKAKTSTKIISTDSKGSSPDPKSCSLPATVDIMGRTVPISVMPNSWDQDGDFDARKVSISVRKDLVPIEQADTLLHECIHGLDYWLHLGMSERQVRLLASGLIGLFQDNPEFAIFVTRPMKGTT